MSLEGHQLGHYRLQRLIGSGGMGEIYLAQDTHIPRQVAVKVLRAEKDYSSDSQTTQEAERLFEREMKAISLLDHPHILPIFDFGTEQIGDITPTYLVMPYRPEGSLLDWLRRQDSAGPLDPDKVVHIVLQAADALQHAHERHIIHQDIKPANFLIRIRNSEADVPDVLLADFGIAKLLDATTSTSLGIRGTPTYMAPEQWEGRPVPASDQYSLAVMAFLLLTGHAPFQGTPAHVMNQHITATPPAPSSVNPRLSPAVDAVLLRALAKQPQERFPSVLQFAQALRQAFQYSAFQPISVAGLDASSIANSQLSQAGGYTPIRPTRQFVSPLSSPGAQQNFASGPAHLQSGSRVLSPSLPSTPPSTPGLFSSAAMQDTPEPTAVPVAAPSNPQAPVQSASAVQPTQPASRFSRPQMFLLIAIAVLVVLGSSGIAIFYALGRSTASRPHTVANMTSKQSDVRREATSIAVAQATATANAQAVQATTATAIANDPYLNGKSTLIVNDPLTTPNYWKITPFSSWGSACLLENGAYHAYQNVVARSAGCSAVPALQASNLIFEVQATIVSGDCGGIRFRYNATAHTGYIFRFCHNGSVALLGQHGALYSSHSAAVRQGYNQHNTIAVAANGAQIRLYINKQPIFSLMDYSFTHGGFAFDVQANKQPTDIAFNNAKIWQL